MSNDVKRRKTADKLRQTGVTSAVSAVFFNKRRNGVTASYNQKGGKN